MHHRIREERFEGRLAHARARQRRDDRLLLALFAVALLLLGLAVVIGPGLFKFRQMQSFVAALDARSDDAIKAQMYQYDADLRSVNPLVRNAAMAGMKAISGQAFATDWQWREWWSENAATWRYQRLPAGDAVR